MRLPTFTVAVVISALSKSVHPFLKEVFLLALSLVLKVILEPLRPLPLYHYQLLQLNQPAPLLSKCLQPHHQQLPQLRLLQLH
jgi:hypothetical protein